jgi:hypothetical protein
MNFTWLFVGAVYAIAVLLARRAGAELPRRVALFFYALTLIFFWQALTQPYINFQADVLPTLPPWRDVTRYHYQYNHELNDLPLQIVPWAHQVRESWKSFEIPLWNHSSGSGYPLLGNGQSSAFSLLRIVALPLELGRAMSAEGAFKILIALTFTFLLCRRRYSLLASVTAAVTFAFSGFLTGWLHFPIATAACLAPAVLYCVELLAERRTFGRFVFAAAMWAQLLFAGHPETAAHLFWLALVWLLWLLFIEKVTAERMRLVLTLGGVMTVAALLAAPYLATFLETAPKSKRVAELKENPLDAGALPYSDWPSAVTMLQPHFWGQVPLEQPWGPSQTEPLGGYAGVLALVAWLATAAGVIARRAWRSREMLFVVLTAFILGVTFNWPLLGEIFHYMMPIAAHARVRLLFVLLASLQVAAAIDLARRIPLLVGVAVTAALLLFLVSWVPFSNAYRFDTAVAAMLPSLAVLVAATLVAVSRTRAAVMLLLAAVTIELFSFGRMRPTPLPEHTLYPETPLTLKLRELAAKQPKNEPFRIAGLHAQLFPNTAAIYGLEDVRAHDPMANARYLGFLKLTANYSVWEYFGVFADPHKPVFDFLNVKYLILDRAMQNEDPQRYATVYDGRDGKILENLYALPRFFAVRNIILEFRDEVFFPNLRDHTDWANTVYLDALTLESKQQEADFFTPRPENAPLAKAELLSAKPTDYRLRVTAPRWSLVASSIPWWPGWRVERNGVEIEPIRVNAVFTGFAVPPGVTNVRVYYSPRSFWWSLYVSIATVLALIIAPVILSREDGEGSQNATAEATTRRSSHFEILRRLRGSE